jgi:tetratricopeptide (TPR) repeat protein
MKNKFDKYFGHIGTVFTIVGFGISYFLPQQYQFYAGGIVVFCILIWLSYFWGRRSVTKEITNKTIQQPFTEALIEFFNKKKAEGKDAEIIRWGSSLSTPLWLSQKYEIRKTIGEFIETSAINLDNTKALIKALIDDIGWTSVELLDYTFAKKKLMQGVELAIEHNEPFWLARGYRHLFGLNFRQNQIEEAEKYLKLSLDVTNNLPEGILKDEVVAEYFFAKSSLERKKGNLEEALKEIEKAKEQYEKLEDKEWVIKILARKGEILVSLNNIEEAKSLFVKGINESKKLQFNRQQVKNLIGLGLCYSATGYNKKAIENFTEAELIAESMGMYYELEIIMGEKIKLRAKE